MPQVHTYIRNEDMEKWKALTNKSEFIHNALNQPTDAEVGEAWDKAVKLAYDPATQTVAGKPIKKVPTVDPVMGMACCRKAKPCQHWNWDADSGAYINSLTGEAKPQDF